jgi:hypothetical protein
MDKINACVMQTKDEILQSLSDGTLLEGINVEFKSAFSDKFADIYAKTIISFANTEGGYLILGIQESKTGCVVKGIQEDMVCGMISSLQNIFSKFAPYVRYSISQEYVAGKTILIVEVFKAETTVYFCRASSPENLISYIRTPSGSTVQDDQSKRYKKIYKYMTLETFMACLYEGSWRFFEPNQWPDRYERRFYCADYQFPNAGTAAPKLYATCLTRCKNSEAAWKVYSNGQALKQHCVQVEINLAEFRNQLCASGYSVEERKVEYIYESLLDDIHKQQSPSYAKYFKPFSIRNFVSLLSLKRDAYAYEEEVRFFLIPKITNGNRSFGKKKSDYVDIKLDWSKIIKYVRVDKHCSDVELKSLQQACFAAGINPVIKKYSWIGNGKSHTTSFVDISFELFCVDDMKGTARLKIK